MIRGALLGATLLCGGLAAGSSAGCTAPPHPLAAPVVIPFELVGNLIYLRVSVEGSAPLSFVLDTGDTYALIDLEVARSLGLSLQGAIDVQGAGSDSLPGRFVENASFRLLGLEDFSQPLFLALPFERLAQAAGHEFAGILGTNFLEPFVVEIDYARRMLTLHDRESFEAAAGLTSLPLDFDSQKHPTVHARLEREGRPALEGVFVLDTGASDFLTLNAPFVRREGLIDSATAAEDLGLGAGGTTRGVVGRLQALELGGLRLASPLVVHSTATGGAHASSEVEGYLGGGLLRRFRIFLDYSCERILLEPGEDFAEPFEHDMSGLRLIADGASYRTFHVQAIAASSPAAAAELRAGDVLIEVDGQPASLRSLAEIRERLRRAGPCALAFEREGERLELEFALRRRF